MRRLAQEGCWCVPWGRLGGGGSPKCGVAPVITQDGSLLRNGRSSSYTAPPMTDSASTPRLRATFAIYIALIATTAVIGPRQVPSWLYYGMGTAGFILVTLAC